MPELPRRGGAEGIAICGGKGGGKPGGSARGRGEDGRTSLPQSFMERDGSFIILVGYQVFVERAIIVDVDGTVVNNSKRLAYAQSRAPMGSSDFWRIFLSGKLFHMDEPLPMARDCLLEKAKLVRIVYLSGRRTGTEEDTRHWLEKHGYPAGEVICRRGGATLPFKTEKVKELRQRYDVVCAIGDSPEDAEAYRLAGVDNIAMVDTNRDWTECPCESEIHGRYGVQAWLH